MSTLYGKINFWVKLTPAMEVRGLRAIILVYFPTLAVGPLFTIGCISVKDNRLALRELN